MIRKLRLLEGLIVASILATIALWCSYCAWFFVNENYRQALSPKLVPAWNWQMMEGEGGVQNSRFRLSSSGYRGYALASGALYEPIESEWLGEIVVNFSQLGGYHELLVGVSSSDSLLNLREASLFVSDDLEGRLKTTDLFLPSGEIGYLTLRARGELEPAIVIGRVELHRVKPSFVELQGLLLESLVDFGDWTQRSINHNRPDYVPLDVSPVVAVALWMVLFGLFALVLLDRSYFAGDHWLKLAGLGFVVGWLLLDVVWQASLWSRHLDGVSKYAGLPSDRKPLNDLDAEVAQFIDEVREALEDYDQSLVIMGNNNFTQMRARYAAVPHPVVSRTGFNGRWLHRLEAGDVLITIGLPNVLKESKQSFAVQSADREPYDWSLSKVAGRAAELVDCASTDIACEGSILRGKGGQRLSLVQSPWLEDLSAGLWLVEFDLQGGSQAGRLRLEVFQRGTGNGRKLWAWREIYLTENQSRQLTLAFRADEHAHYHIRLRQLDARGVAVRAARLAPQLAGDNLVELSPDGNPPYYVARRVHESEGKFAWEML